MDNEPETKRKGRRFPDAPRIQDTKKNTAGASAEDSPTKRKGRGFEDATRGGIKKSGAPVDSVEGPSTRRKTKVCTDAPQTRVAKKDTAGASTEDRPMKRKGRGFAATTRAVTKNSGAGGGPAEDPSTKRKAKGIPNAVKSQIGKIVTTSASAGGPAMGKKSSGLPNPTRNQVEKRGGAASASRKEGTTAQGGKTRGTSNAALRPARQSSAATASKKGDSVVRGGKGRGLEGDARTKVGKRGASVESDTIVRCGQRHGDPKATQGLAGKCGAPFASGEDPPMKRKGGGFKDAAPTMAQTSGAPAGRAEGDMVRGGEGRGGSSAARSQVGRSGGSTNSVESDSVGRHKGRGLVTGSVPSGRRGSARGDSGDVIKPEAPESHSNTLGAHISIAAGRRPTGNSGRAIKSSQGSGASAPAKPVSLRGPQKGLAPSKDEDVLASTQASMKHVNNTPYAGLTRVKRRDESESYGWWKGGAREDKGQQKTPCGAEGEESLVEASAPGAKDTQAVAEALASSGDKVALGQAEAVQGGESGSGKNAREVAAVASMASVAPAAPAAVATLEVAVPPDVSQVADVKIPTTAATNTERMVEAFVPKEQDAAEDLTEAAAVPADKFAACQADVFQGGEADGGEDGGRAALVTLATAATAGTTTREVGVPAVLDTPYVAQGTENIGEACAPEEKEAETSTESAASPGDKVAAEQTETIQDGKEDNGQDGQEATAVVQVAPAVVATLEVVESADISQDANVDTPCVAKGTERVVDEFGPNEQHAGGLTDEVSAPDDEFAACQAEASQGSEKDGNDAEEVDEAAVVAPAAPTAPAAVVAGELAAPTDVGQMDNVETACAAESSEPLVDALPSEAQDTEDLAGAAAALADELGADQAEGILDGGGHAGNSSEEPGAALVVVATLEVDVPPVISRASDVRTPYVAQDTKRIVEVCAPEEKEAETSTESAASPGDKIAAEQTEPIQDGKEDNGQDGQEATAALPVAPAVVATLEVVESADISQDANVDTPCVAKGTERVVDEFGPNEQHAGGLTDEVSAPDDEFAACQAEAAQGGEKDDGNDDEEVAEAAVVAPAAVVTGELAAPTDVGQMDNVETARAAESSEPLVDALPSETRDTENLAGATAPLADELGTDQAEGILDGGGKIGNSSEEPGAALVVVATLEVDVPPVISRASDVRTPYVAQDTKRIVEVCAPEGKEAETPAESAASPGDKVATEQAEPIQDGKEDNGQDGQEATAVVLMAPAVVTLEVVESADISQDANVDTPCATKRTERVADEFGPHEQHAGGLTDAATAPADELPAGQAEAVQSSGEDCVEAASAGMVRTEGGRRRGRGLWKRLVSRSGILILTILLGVVGASLFQGFEKPPTCGRKTVLFDDGPLKPGECMESDGGSRWFGWATGMAWKSRLSASEDGGQYMGPDGSKVPLQNVVWETDVTGGVLCSAERLVRKATGLGNVRYGVSPRDANPLPRAGLFCHVREPPSSPSVLSVPRRGTARFSEGGDLEVLNSRGKVLWSAREGMDLHRVGGKGTDKRSSDAAKAKHDMRRKREERLKAEAGERKATGKGGWGARVRKLWGKDSGGDGQAVTKPSGGQGRGISRVFRWVRGPRHG